MARMTNKRSILARKTWQDAAEVWRAKIETAKIVKRINKAALGEVDMKATELKAALGLLGKVMPDLSASEVIRRNEEINPIELLNKLREANPELAPILEQYIPSDEKDDAVRH